MTTTPTSLGAIEPTKLSGDREFVVSVIMGPGLAQLMVVRGIEGFAALLAGIASIGAVVLNAALYLDWRTNRTRPGFWLLQSYWVGAVGVVLLVPMETALLTIAWLAVGVCAAIVVVESS